MTLQRYSDYAPTPYDSKGLALCDQQAWLVAPVIRTRDSDPLEESNFQTALRELGDESDTVEVHRFGHWGPGWYEIIIIDPLDVERVAIAEKLKEGLEIYPILDEDDHSEREHEAAHETWKHCYSPEERVKYIRRHRSQFDFYSLTDVLGCVRGHYFRGCASELLS